MSMNKYTVKSTPPLDKAPLIFAFHGTGGDEHQFFDLAKSLHPDAGVVSPRGNVSEGGAERFFRRTGEGRYDMVDLAARAEQLGDFVVAWKAEYPDNPVFGFGYSNGANILAALMMSRPDLFDRVGLLHPLIPWEPADIAGLSGKPVLISAGRHDPICPWPLSAQLIDWFERNGAVVTAEVHGGGHEIRQGEIDGLARLFRSQ
ncbi:MAG: alpha/beta hydrolase [Cognatishimia sp.]